METLIILGWAIDGLVAIGLIWLARQALSSPSLFTAVVLFVAFGLLLTLAWVRLNAPDVALAEAAIGAGVTGALLLGALARLRGGGEHEPPNAASRRVGTRNGVRLLAGAGALVAVCGFAATLAFLAPKAAGLSAEVTRSLRASAASAILLRPSCSTSEGMTRCWKRRCCCWP